MPSPLIPSGPLNVIAPAPDGSGAFELWREMGCTERELQSWIPIALARYSYVQDPQRVTVEVPPGLVTLHYAVMEPRRIAQISMARVQVMFRFDTLNREQINAFLKHFDLYTMRGGG